MKKLFALFSLVAVAALAQTLTQKIEVRVVNVDVAVTGPDGMPVRGLTRDDFQLFEDGKPQPITNFYAVAGTPASSPADLTASTPPAASAPPQEDPRFRRKVLVLIDNNHITPYTRNVALQKLEQFIDDRFRGGEYDWSIAAVGTRVGIVLPLTSDKARIHATLDAIRKLGANRTSPGFQQSNDPSLPSNQFRDADLQGLRAADTARLGFSQDMDDKERYLQARYTTRAIVDAARGFAGASGKKIVLLLTDDPGLNDVDVSTFGGPNTAIMQRDLFPHGGSGSMEVAAELSKLRQRLVEEANASNVSFYVMNVAGLKPAEDADTSAAGGRGPTNNAAGFSIAEQTGGKMMPGNNPIESLRTFETASSNYYSLGFHPAHEDDGKYHKLTVKLTKAGNYRVHHRAGYSNVPDEAQLERALQSEITIPIENSSLPLQLVTEAPQPQPEKDIVLVPFRAKIPIDKLQFLPAGDKWKANIDIYVSAFDEHGKNITLKRFTTTATATSANPDPTGVFVYRNGVLMRKGPNQRLVVALRDQTTEAVGMAGAVVKTE
jgi:VWFA-related protein